MSLEAYGDEDTISDLTAERDALCGLLADSNGCLQEYMAQHKVAEEERRAVVAVAASLTEQLAALRAEVAKVRQDYHDAAGELLVNIDDAQPGTLVAKLLTANRIMARERDALRAEISALRENCERLDLGNMLALARASDAGVARDRAIEDLSAARAEVEILEENAVDRYQCLSAALAECTAYAKSTESIKAERDALKAAARACMTSMDCCDTMEVRHRSGCTAQQIAALEALL